MSQLTIVVISIALSAVIGLIGLNSIGPAFLDGKDKAIALQYVQQGAQIATAWKAWARARTAQYPPPTNQYLTQLNWETGTSSDLVPGFLSALPNTAVALTNYASWLPYDMNSFSISGAAPNQQSASTSVNAIAALLANTKQAVRICNQVAILSQGAAGVPFALGGATAIPRNNASYDCAYKDNNSNGALDATDGIYIIYRVF